MLCWSLGIVFVLTFVSGVAFAYGVFVLFYYGCALEGGRGGADKIGTVRYLLAPFVVSCVVILATLPCGKIRRHVPVGLNPASMNQDSV